MGKLRAQFDRVVATKGCWTVCSLLLVSIVLAGCNKTNTTGRGGASATSAPTTAAAASAPAAQPTPTTSPSTDKSADVSWTAPTTNTNGSALTDLAGYRIYYGTSPDTLNQTVDVPNAGASDYVVTGLAQGTWYFAVAAYTNTGLQSALSNVASKTIT